MDVASRAVKASIPLTFAPLQFALTPDGSRLHVTGGPVVAIGTSTNQIVATITLPASSAGLAITPDGTKVYVANWVQQPPPDRALHPNLTSSLVSVIATSSNTVTATIGVPYNSINAPALTVTLDGAQVYVVTQYGLTVIATSTNAVATKIDDTSEPLSLAPSPDGSRIYVGEAFGTLSVVQTSSNTLTKRVAVPSNITALAVTKNNGTLFAAASAAGQVVALDISAGLRITRPSRWARVPAVWLLLRMARPCM